MKDVDVLINRNVLLAPGLYRSSGYCFCLRHASVCCSVREPWVRPSRKIVRFTFSKDQNGGGRACLLCLALQSFVYILCLRQCQSRLAGSMMFSTWSFVCPFICSFFRCQTCKQDNFKTNEQILLQIGASGLRDKAMKRSTVEIRRSKISHTTLKLDLEASFSTHSVKFKCRFSRCWLQWHRTRQKLIEMRNIVLLLIFFICILNVLVSTEHHKCN